MEHIIIKDLGNGCYNLIPEKGYILYNIQTKQTYSDAVTKDINIFKSIKL